MAKIDRKTQKIFGESAGSTGITEYATPASGSPVYSTDLDSIQTSGWLTGWAAAATAGRDIPAYQDFNAIQYVSTKQIAYLFQEGVAEYDAGTEYHTNSIVKKSGTYELYGSKINSNTDNALPVQVDDANWEYLGSLTNLGEVPDGSVTTDKIADDAVSSVKLSSDLSQIQLSIEGLELSNNSSDSDHDIDIDVGKVMAGDGDKVLTLASPITKQIDSTFAAGTNAGGLDTGAVAANTVYYVWLIEKDSDGTVDALLSLSKSSPTMPSGYTRKRRIGTIATDGSNNIRSFQQQADYFYFESNIELLSTGTPPTARTDYSTLTPASEIAIINISSVVDATQNHYALVQNSNFTDQVPTSSLNNYSNGGVGSQYGQRPQKTIHAPTDSSGNISVRFNSTTGSVVINVNGFIDRRGK